MKSKKFLAIAGIFSLAVFSIGLAAIGADTQSVTATVTPKNISVTVSPGSVDYGTVAINTESAPSVIITASNNGNVAENFNIKGSNSTNWTLSDTAAGADTFMHKFAKSGDSYAAYTALHNTNYTALATAVGTSGSQLFKLKLITPTSTATYAQQSTTVTIQATE
ncbi:hypothetical protein EPN15_03385 [Patescibacteria group bacterium]|nr:MAG: hypothetical protein EPN15_03385 [Patescibacteria group bacterium]